MPVPVPLLAGRYSSGKHGRRRLRIGIIRGTIRACAAQNRGARRARRSGRGRFLPDAGSCAAIHTCLRAQHLHAHQLQLLGMGAPHTHMAPAAPRHRVRGVRAHRAPAAVHTAPLEVQGRHRKLQGRPPDHVPLGVALLRPKVPALMSLWGSRRLRCCRVLRPGENDTDAGANGTDGRSLPSRRWKTRTEDLQMTGRAIFSRGPWCANGPGPS